MAYFTFQLVDNYDAYMQLLTRGNIKHGVLYLLFFCFAAHFVLGILVLPSKELAPRIFTPMILAIIAGARKMVNLCFPTKWRPDLNEILDEIVLVEPIIDEVGNRGGVEENYPSNDTGVVLMGVAMIALTGSSYSNAP